MGTPRVSTAEKVTLRSVLTDPLVRPIIGLVFVVLTGFGVVIPALPLFARSLGVGYDGTGLFIATFGFARLFGDLVAGPLVDRKGERWTAVAGMIGLALCSTATGLAPNFIFALIFWGLAGVGSAIVFASLFSYILKAAPKDRMARTLSFFYGAFNIGVVTGGAIGGFVANAYGLASPLFVYSGLLVVAIFVYVKTVPQIPDRAEATEATDLAAASLPERRIVRDLLKLPGFATTLMLNFTYLWFVAAIFNTLLSLFASDELGMSTAAIGGVFAVALAAEFAVLFPAGSLADRYGRRAVLIPSLLGLSVAIAVLGFSTSVWMLTVLLALLAVASGFAGVPPAAMLSDIVPTEQSGRAVGAFRFCGDLGFFFGPLIAGATSKSFGFKTAFIVTAIPPLIALVATLRTAETLRDTER